MENEFNRDHDRNNGYFSKKLRAGKRRTYFFDVRATKGNDYYLTITESKKRPNQSGYDSHKIFLYKEDFKKFIESLEETIHHIKTELMPEFDFENFTRDSYFENREREDQDGAPEEHHTVAVAASSPPEPTFEVSNSSADNSSPTSHENVDTW